MMSVPAINSVLPPSGNQPPKINSSPTANPSVSPIGLSVPPKISVIPTSQISTSPSKPPVGVNHSSVPLSLVFENKVGNSSAQATLPKPLTDKPKDLSPVKPTPNGVEIPSVKTPPPQNQQPQTASSKPEVSAPIPPPSAPSTTTTSTTATTETPASAATTPATPTTNHSEDRIPVTSSDPTRATKNEEPTATQTSQPQEKVEQNQNETKKEEENKTETNIETKEQIEDAPKTEATATEKLEEKTPTTSQGSSKRKREQKEEEKKDDKSQPEKKPRRIRSQVLPYQSPLPELTTVFNKSLKEKDASQKNTEEKLTVFYKNEFLAVRNAEGGFYLCQTLQNVYRSSHRIRIRWLSQKKESSTEDGDVYTPDFYDLTDFECILTTVNLSKMEKNMYKLPKEELDRIESILKRALDVEKGVAEKPSITEEHPDGLDLSLYKDESQLQKPKKAAKRKAPSSPSTKSSKQAKKDQSGESEVKETPVKKPKGKSKSKPPKKTTKTSPTKSKAKRGGKSDSSKSKAVDQLKVSPPNEKARVVAKAFRKVDIVPAKKQTKSKVAKKSTGGSKSVKKKGQKGGIKKETGKEEHHEKRQGKTKNNKKKIRKN